MALSAAMGSLLGGIGGGILGGFGQHSANQMNWKIAKRQMAFQERMSNTAYTRAAKDLENAGLNRILALGNPASSPGGATAQMGNVGGAAVEGFSKAQASALAVKTANTQLRLMEEQAKNVGKRTETLEGLAEVSKTLANFLKGGNVASSSKGIIPSLSGGLTNLLEWMDPGGGALSKPGQASSAMAEAYRNKKGSGGRPGHSIEMGDTRIEDVGKGIYQVWKKRGGKWVKDGAPKDQSYFRRKK